MADICGDNRFEIISRAKEALIESTNIEDSPKEMAVLDNFLFRCWQMGWLDKYKAGEQEYVDELLKQLEVVEKEYPYKVVGQPETYSQYNEAWQDCIDRVIGIVKGGAE